MLSNCNYDILSYVKPIFYSRMVKFISPCPSVLSSMYDRLKPTRIWSSRHHGQLMNMNDVDQVFVFPVKILAVP